jgi:hypothetical protein
VWDETTLATGKGTARVLKSCIAGSENRASAAVVTRVLGAAVGDDRASATIMANIHELSCQAEEFAGGENRNRPIGSIRPPQQGQRSCG